MANRRGARRAPKNPWYRSERMRAALGLGVALGIGATGTFAHWTEDVAITGATFTAGDLNLNVNGADPYTGATDLSMPAMSPGSSSAQVLTINNVGTIPAKYTLSGGLTGTGASDYNSAGSNGLLVTIRSGGTKSGSGSTATCTGGTVVLAETPLTNTTSTPLLAKRPTSPLAATNGSESLCFQVRLAPTAPTGLQGKTASATFTATGTSDVS